MEIDARLVVMTKMTWDELDDGEKAVLHLAATLNHPADLEQLEGWPKTKPLATETGNAMHSETAKSVEILAAKWHGERALKDQP